jgi:hypothetical protein
MAEIRGEKVKFGKGDYKRLHELPSAQVEDPIIVHCPPPRSLSRFFLRFITIFLLLTVAAGAFLVGVIQGGAVDHLLTTQASQALERTINPRFQAKVGGSTIRFDDNLRLSLVATDVDISDRETGRHLTRVGDVSMRLDPLSLMIGQLSVDSLGVEDVQLDTGLLPAGDGLQLDGLSIASVPKHSDKLFELLDGLSATLGRSNTKRITLENMRIDLPAASDGSLRRLTIQALEVNEKPSAAGYTLAGEVEVDGVAASLELDATLIAGKVGEAQMRLDGFDVEPFLKKLSSEGEIIEGVNAKIGLIVNARRAAKGIDPMLNVTLGIGNGTIHLSGEEQALSSGRIVAAYDYERDEIYIDQSMLILGNNHLPLEAVLRDGSKGPEFIANIKDGKLSSSLGNEQPVAFNLRANGGYDMAARAFSIPDLLVTGPMGNFAGSLKIAFGDTTPEISFGGQIPNMQATAVKQLWPFWMAKRARYWVHNNIFGGTVTNGSISVFIPKGRMCGYGCPMNLNERELDISFDIADTRINVTGEIPPLRDINAKFQMQGGKLEVDVAKATAFFPSDRTLDLKDSTFTVPSFYVKPLLADVKLNVSGKADAVAELATLRPIHALQKTEFKPDDFSGDVRADVNLRIGIAAAGNPAPVWDAKLALSKMSLKPQIAGREIKDVDGEMLLDADSLTLKGKGKVDDLAADINYIQPLGTSGKVKQQIGLNATLSGAQMNKLAPGLSAIISGSTKLSLDIGPDKKQSIKLDLTNSALTLPGIGWQKGAGIPANAKFSVVQDGQKLQIDDFALSGSGFGAEGKFSLNKGKLVSAAFSKMQLSPSDSYSVNVSAGNNLMEVTARGSSIDLRSLLGQFRDGAGGQENSESKASVDVNLRFDRALGFHDEVLSNVDGIVSLRDGKLRRVDFKSVIGRGEAVVAQTTRNGNVSTINLTSSDAGRLARFTNLYSRINSGLVNLKFSTTNGESWSGSVDMRNFAVTDESKLQYIVTTPTGADGRSLNKAVKRNINVSSERFQRAFARLVYVNGAVALENGIIRGEQIGATFQGLLRDRAGNMEMTGTFMPAYGLNRIFGELPIIGAILGNGTDRGLLGITFKLSGKTASPNLVVNPLSLIAPGIFRQIFEFQ